MNLGYCRRSCCTLTPRTWRKNFYPTNEINHNKPREYSCTRNYITPNNRTYGYCSSYIYPTTENKYFRNSYVYSLPKEEIWNRKKYKANFTKTFNKPIAQVKILYQVTTPVISVKKVSQCPDYNESKKLSHSKTQLLSLKVGDVSNKTDSLSVTSENNSNLPKVTERHIFSHSDDRKSESSTLEQVYNSDNHKSYVTLEHFNEKLNELYSKNLENIDNLKKENDVSLYGEKVNDLNSQTLQLLKVVENSRMCFKDFKCELSDCTKTMHERFKVIENNMEKINCKVVEIEHNLSEHSKIIDVQGVQLKKTETNLKSMSGKFKNIEIIENNNKIENNNNVRNIIKINEKVSEFDNKSMEIKNLNNKFEEFKSQFDHDQFMGKNMVKIVNYIKNVNLKMKLNHDLFMVQKYKSEHKDLIENLCKEENLCKDWADNLIIWMKMKSEERAKAENR